MRKDLFKIKRSNIELSDASLSFIGIVTKDGYLAEELRSIQCHPFDGYGKPRPVVVERILEFSPTRQDIFSPSSTDEERAIEAAQIFLKKKLKGKIEEFYSNSPSSYIEDSEIVFPSNNARGYYEQNPISPQDFVSDIKSLGYIIIEEMDIHSGDYQRKIW